MTTFALVFTVIFLILALSVLVYALVNFVSYLLLENAKNKAVKNILKEKNK